MKITVIGGGESGVGAALLAKKKGYDVFLSEFKELKKEFREELINNEIDFEENGHDFERFEHSDLVVKSPGIAENTKPVQWVREKGIKLVSEIEFGFTYYDGYVIGVTGSNGKTTTTKLAYHILKEGGLDVVIGGNYGISFCRQIVMQNSKYAVLELSSFQLDDVDAFRPDIAVLLNISPDHLDRYEYDLEKYASAKWNITKNQKAGDLCIYNADDPWIRSKINGRNSKVRNLSISSQEIKFGIPSKDGVYKLKLLGRHNVFNAACAIAIAKELNLDDDKIQNGLLSFVNDPHRLELVRIHSGVEFINDSKATNVEAVYYALEAMQKKTIWIVGGVDKGNDYSTLFPLVEAKVEAIVCLGVDNSKLLDAFENRVQEIVETQNIEEAVQWAQEKAKVGYSVLLSPACASFDLFNNYKHRGDLFKEAIFKLK